MEREKERRRGRENIWSTIGTTGAIRCSRVLERWTQGNDGALTCASGVSWYSEGSVLTPLGEGKGSGGRHMSTHGTTVTTWQCVVECLPSLSEYMNVWTYERMNVCECMRMVGTRVKRVATPTLHLARAAIHCRRLFFSRVSTRRQSVGWKRLKSATVHRFIILARSISTSTSLL